MNTQTKGDVLADRIEAIMATPHVFICDGGRLTPQGAIRAALAEYRAPLPAVAEKWAAEKQAFKEGKKVECRHPLYEPRWAEMINDVWLNDWEYRVKPEPVMVQLGPEDVPPGSVAQRIDAECKSSHLTIQLHQGIGEPIVENQLISFGKLRKHYLIHRPGTLTEDGKPLFVRCEKEAK